MGEPELGGVVLMVRKYGQFYFTNYRDRLGVNFPKEVALRKACAFISMGFSHCAVGRRAVIY